MEDESFDRLTVQFSALASRRGAFSRVLRTVLGGTLLSQVPSSQTAAEKRKGKGRDDEKRGRRKESSNRKKGRRRDRAPASDQTDQGGLEGQFTENETLAGDEISTADHGCRHAGAACTKGGQCCSGKCLKGGVCSCNASNPCPRPKNPCKGVTCTNSRCTYVNKLAGVRCSDGIACTTGDVCDGNGRCQGTAQNARCPSSVPCHRGSCRPSDPNRDANGCVQVPITSETTSDCGPPPEGGAVSCASGVCQRWCFDLRHRVCGSDPGVCQECCKGEGCNLFDLDNRAICVGGTCQCPDQLTYCDGRCVNTRKEPNHCGGCGIRCASGTCDDGTCRTPDSCGTVCPPKDPDLECDVIECPPGNKICLGETPRRLGSCVCPPGWVDCNGDGFCERYGYCYLFANCPPNVANGQPGKRCPDGSCSCGGKVIDGVYTPTCCGPEEACYLYSPQGGSSTAARATFNYEQCEPCDAPCGIDCNCPEGSECSSLQRCKQTEAPDFPGRTAGTIRYRR